MHLRINIIEQIPDEFPIFLISGRAVFLKSNTIEEIINQYEGGCLYSIKKRIATNILNFKNDIVYGYTFQQILESINNTLQYIRKRKPNSKIYFLQCLHVNGRLDRDNKHIDRLNEYLKSNLEIVNWIDTCALDDELGNLKAEYTLDGLNLSKKGYEIFKRIIEQEVI